MQARASSDDDQDPSLINSSTLHLLHHQKGATSAERAPHATAHRAVDRPDPNLLDLLARAHDLKECEDSK
jgi:hypothetical protein